MKQLIPIIAIVFSICVSLPANAVTEKEMEQARTIATQTYLRYANDGSGYLDEHKPKTMAELEKILKNKEKENIKAFKAIPVPKDYASWDKAKLVEYWSKTAFASKGLTEKGRIGKSTAAKKLNAMQVSAPSAAPKATEPAKPTAEATPAKAGDNTVAPASDPNGQASVTAATEDTKATEAADSIATVLQEQQAADMAILAEEQDEEIKKAENHTWIYIVILFILVGVVVALVVFASNVMKKNNASSGNSSKNIDSDTHSGIPPADYDKNLAAALSSKNEEVKSLNKKLVELAHSNDLLKGKLEAVTAENAQLRSRIAELRNKNTAEQPRSATRNPSPEPRPASQQNRQVQEQRPIAQKDNRQPAAAPRQGGNPLRTIYLGKANAKGIFVRAERTLNPGNTIYRLDTTDGFSGSFRVVNDPSVWDSALANPVESLGGGCQAADLMDTAGAERIVTDSSGTAVFEGGAWKVIRKAKIHYE